MWKLTSQPFTSHADYYETTAEMAQALRDIADNLNMLVTGESVTFERVAEPDAVAPNG